MRNAAESLIYQLVDILEISQKRILIDNLYYVIVKGLVEGWNDARIALLARYTESYTSEIVNKSLDILSHYYGDSLTRDNFRIFFERLLYEQENNA